MALGNLRAIGPIEVEYRNPALVWTSNPTNHGISTCSISGTVEIPHGHQLRELVDNPAARTAVHGHVGVLEWLDMDGDSLAPLAGYYLLESFALDVDRQYVYGGRVSFSLTAAYLGGLS